MHRINSDNLSQKAADSIAERIIHRQLLPGERLVEAKMARDFGVSQGTIREALRILEKKKMVTILPRRGTTVTKLTADYIDSLYDFQAGLYSMMVRKAMQKMTEVDRKLLAEMLGTIRKGLEKRAGVYSDEYGDAIFDTLSIFLRIANDPFIEHAITDLWPVTRWVQFETLLYKEQEHIDNYLEINTLEMAINSDDVADVSQRVWEYTQYAKQIILKAFGCISNVDADGDDAPEAV